ncbi:MAG: ATP-binding cassette domain-containing protein [Candidatus Korarchaeota archaeon]|nr:ATP-binding cassette domain-containing protein [Candidatus Korarchaeota archaeon]NIU85638.1 ATP-binding cassette domain-containing protein [Candidatus Thorarchaeota archaeon]NIW12950.1 ATP-binding cassette domain-containing protein [Candidatus Thorarchaeota archaeon]NIW51095.1 ATP-binding cassette domain-containing protein [Candidatus Korarchaeota archaeon]
MDAISVDKLTKYYDDFLAVDQISFKVQQGEFFGLLGPNGAGKTTTIRTLTGLLKPTSGNLRVMGTDVTTNPVGVKRQIGVISESASPYLEMSAWNNLMFAGSLHELSKSEREMQAENLLKLLGIYDRRHEKVEHFSKGLRKRVTIAIALIHEPPLLFLDEPTVGLDVQSARMIRGVLRRLNEEGTTIFLTTHYIEEADTLCDRIGIIKKGKLVAIAPPEELKATNNQEKVVEVSFDIHSAAIEEKVSHVPTVVKTEKRGDKLRLYTHNTSTAVKDVCQFAKEEGLEIVYIQTLSPTLEDAFVKLTGFSSLDLERMERIGQSRKKKMQMTGG